MTEYLKDATGRVYTMEDWRVSGNKITEAPATLTDTDIEVIKSFGGAWERAVAAREKALAQPETTTATGVRITTMDMAQIGGLVGTVVHKELGPIRAKIARVPALDELTDMVILTVKTALGPLNERLAAADSVMKAQEKLIDRQQQQLEAYRQELGAVRERVAVNEGRAPQAGPQGPPGEAGVGFDDLMLEHDGERTITVKAARGERVKVIGTVTLPSLIYRGVHQAGKMYAAADVCTWDGSIWIASGSTTDKPGDGSKFWTLAVKKGSPGRDLRDAKDVAATVPVVSVGKPRPTPVFSNAPAVS